VVLKEGEGMTESVDAAPHYTLTDIEVGSRLVEALILHAQEARGATIAYDDLLTLARTLAPKDATLGRAVPVGIGMKLQYVAQFCAVNGYPNLASLAVDRTSGLPAAAYRANWDDERAAVAAFDWSTAGSRLPAYASAVRATVPARLKPRKERPADVAWYAYFCSHRAACAQVTGDDKKEIINLLMSGLDPDTALRRVLAAKAA
jgi:hypothetical protein